MKDKLIEILEDVTQKAIETRKFDIKIDEALTSIFQVLKDELTIDDIVKTIHDTCDLDITGKSYKECCDTRNEPDNYIDIIKLAKAIHTMLMEKLS